MYNKECSGGYWSQEGYFLHARCPIADGIPQKKATFQKDNIIRTWTPSEHTRNEEKVMPNSAEQYSAQCTTAGVPRVWF